MARSRELISSFTLGEVSPRLFGRTDVPQYRQACEEITNMNVYVQGGVARRPGTEYLSNAFQTKTSAKGMSFSKSKEESYQIVFTIDPGGHGISVWDSVNKVFLDVDDTFFNETDYPVYSRFDGFSSALELQEIQYRQFGNAIFFAQKDNPPFALDFASVDEDGTVYLFPFWAYKTIGQRDASGLLLGVSAEQIADAWPYLTPNSDAAKTVKVLGTTTGPQTLEHVDIFSAGHVGSLIRATGDSAVATGVARIDTIINDEDATVNVIRDFEDTNTTTTWALSSWSNAHGWPKAITFHHNRIYYGFTYLEPNGVWGSAVGDVSRMRQELYIEDIALGVTNADAWSVRITDVNIIQWLSSNKTLFIGALDGECNAYGPDQSLDLGPKNFQFDTDTAYGSSLVQPIRRDSVIVFVQRSGRMLREVSFNFDENTYRAPKIMNLAEHMPRKTQDLLASAGISNGEIVEIAHQESDNGITYFRDSNGGIFGMTRDRDSEGQPTGFHYHQIAGTTAVTPGGKVLSIWTSPSENGSFDDIYMCVRRSWATGPDRTYFEKISREYEGHTIYDPLISTAKPIYVDSALVSTLGAPSVTHPGFTHLYQCGYSVQVVADGHYVGEVVPDASGNITLLVAATEVIAGLKYRSQVIPAQLNTGSVIGTSQAAEKTSDQIHLRFVRSIGGIFAFAFDGEIDEGQLYDIEFRDPNAPQNDPIDLFTGVKEVTPPLGWARKVNVVVRQDLPFPQHLTSMVSQGITND